MTEEIGSNKPVIKNNYTGKGEASSSAPTDREPVKRIINQNDLKQRKPLGRKIAETFGGEDLKTVAGYVMTDVVFPKFKELVFDAAMEGMHRSLFGSSRRSGSSRDNRTQTTPYNSMYVNRNKGSENRGYGSSAPSEQSRGILDYRDFVIPSRGQAEEVIDGMCSVLDQYGTVSVHELKEMLGVTGEFTDQKWGWKNLRDAGVSRDREGYRLDLPKPISLD
jgi:hypothetical protein